MTVRFSSPFYSSNSSQRRVEIISKLQTERPEPPSDYWNFGYSYFDDSNCYYGYQGYRYDGRFASGVRNICQRYKPKAVLEIGSAKGFILAEFQKLQIESIGIEISDYARLNAVASVRGSLFPSIHSVSNEILRRCDLIVSRDTLPHLHKSEIVTILECLKTKCNPNVSFILEFNYADNPEELKQLELWDPTNKTLESKEWWLRLFANLKLRGEIFFKPLLPKDDVYD